MNSLCLESSPDVCFISKSKLCNREVELLRCRLSYPNCFNVEASGRRGGLILFWKENVNVNVLSYSSGHIDCVISVDPCPFYFTSFYGNPSQGIRQCS